MQYHNILPHGTKRRSIGRSSDGLIFVRSLFSQKLVFCPVFSSFVQFDNFFFKFQVSYRILHDFCFDIITIRAAVVIFASTVIITNLSIRNLSIILIKHNIRLR